jgi:PAS domain S-box-containing protein
MMEGTAYHRLLQRQIKKARSKSPDSDIDLDVLLDLVSQAYTEHDDAMRLNDRAVTLMSGELTELHERLRRESELRARNSEAQLKAVLDNAGEAIISVSRDGIIVAPNRAAEKIFGYPSRELVGKPISVLFDQGTPERFVERAAQADAPHVDEARCRRRSGEVFPAEVSFSRIAFEGGVLLISFWRDISGRKAAEARLVEAAEEAQAASLSKSHFLANMSHELRTPLNAIIGFADILKDEILGPLGAPKYREYVRDIAESGAHLLQLVNDILDLSRIESGRYQLTLQPLNLGEIAVSVERQFEVLAQQKRIRFVNSIGHDLPPISGDHRALRQVLYNLVSNAIKFTREGGEVSLSAAWRRDVIELAVTDTGIGIPKEALPRLGRPFEQVETSYARTHGGTGLGLAITKKLIGLHSGSLIVESELGVGSTFTVRFAARTLAKTG